MVPNFTSRLSIIIIIFIIILLLLILITLLLIIILLPCFTMNNILERAQRHLVTSCKGSRRNRKWYCISAQVLSCKENTRVLHVRRQKVLQTKCLHSGVSEALAMLEAPQGSATSNVMLLLWPLHTS